MLLMYLCMRCGNDARHAIAAEEGDVRLVSEENVGGATTGVLQVFCDGAWGAVCNANFGNSDAVVACRQLGFAAGAPVTHAFADVEAIDEVLPVPLLSVPIYEGPYCQLHAVMTDK